MPSDYIRITDLIRAFEKKSAEIAHHLASGVSYEDYLRGVGRYKATAAFIDSLRSRLEKRGIAEEDENELEFDDDEPGTKKEPEPEPAPRRTKPRGWGGE